MFLYFNRQGKLLTAITNPPFRVGNKKANTIFAIFERGEKPVTEATIRIAFNDNKVIETIFPMKQVKKGECVLKPEDFDNGINTKIGNLKWNHDYSEDVEVTVLKYTFDNTLLMNGKCTATIVTADGFAQGEINFYIESNILTLTELSADEDDEYQTILDLLNNKVDWDDDSTSVLSLGLSKQFLLENKYTSVLDYINKNFVRFVFIDKNNISFDYLKLINEKAKCNIYLSLEQETIPFNTLQIISPNHYILYFEQTRESSTTDNLIIKKYTVNLYSSTEAKENTIREEETNVPTKEYLDNNFVNNTEIQKYQKKLKAGHNITIEEDNTINSVDEYPVIVWENNDWSLLNNYKTPSVYKVIKKYKEKVVDIAHLYVVEGTQLNTFVQYLVTKDGYYLRKFEKDYWTEAHHYKYPINGVTYGVIVTKTPVNKGAILSFVTGEGEQREIDAYLSLIDHNNTTPETNPENWKKLSELLNSKQVNDIIDSKGFILSTEKGKPNGVASLDENGHVPASQIPGSVDEYVEYPTFNDFPKVGQEDKIYLAKDTNKTYRWSGTQYAIIGSDLALGETSETAYAGDKGKKNRDDINALEQNKISKSTERSIVYGTNGQGYQETIPYNKDPIGGGLAQRNNDGTLMVADPTQATDAVNLQYFNANKGKDLTIASSTTLGGIKVGEDFDISIDGKLSLYHPININSFYNSIGSVPFGQTITSVKLTWSTNKVPTLLQLENEDIVPLTTTSKELTNLSITTNKTWTLKVGDGKKTQTSSTSIIFMNYVLYGVGSTYDSTKMQKTLSNSKGRTFTVTAGTTDHIFYAIPSRLGTPTFFVGGFEGGFNELRKEQWDNGYGYSEEYTIYQSTNVNLGNTTVEVI